MKCELFDVREYTKENKDFYLKKSRGQSNTSSYKNLASLPASQLKVTNPFLKSRKMSDKSVILREDDCYGMS